MSEQLDKSTSLVTYWKREAARLQAEVVERTADLALVTLQRRELTAEVERWRGSSGGPRAIERIEELERELKVLSGRLERELDRAIPIIEERNAALARAERAETVIMMAGNWPQTVAKLEEALSTFPAGRAFLKQWSDAEAEIISLRMCSTCCGTPHASGLPCICGGTNSREEEVKGLRLAAMKAEDRNPSYTIPISAKQSAGRTYEILAQHLAFRANQLRKLGLTFAADELTVMQKKCSDAMEDIANDVQGMYFGSRYTIGKNDAETLAAHALEAQTLAATR